MLNMEPGPAEVSLHKCVCLAGLLDKAQTLRAVGERADPKGEVRP